VGGEPTIHLHTILEAIALLVHPPFPPPPEDILEVYGIRSDLWIKTDRMGALYEGEFNVPLLWNSNFFMTTGAMELLREVIDIWMPDFKFGNRRCATRLSRTPNYLEAVQRNHKLVYEWGEDVFIRHLIMPNHVECCTKPVLDWIKANMPDVPVNVMDQFHPDSYCNPYTPKYDAKYADINRNLTEDEILVAYAYAKALDLRFEELSYEKPVQGLRL